MENRKIAGRKRVATKATTSASIKNKRAHKKAKEILDSLTQEEKDFIEGKNFPIIPSKGNIHFLLFLFVSTIGLSFLLYQDKQKKSIAPKKKRSAVKTKEAVVKPIEARKVAATKKANSKVKK